MRRSTTMDHLSVSRWLKKPAAPPVSQPYKAGKAKQVVVENLSSAKALIERLRQEYPSREIKRVDLKQVVSKYIGETEKNLRAVFDAAEATSSILFFDEADALFGKRTSIRDSHDKYASDAAYLLKQLIKRYDGIVVISLRTKCD